MQVTETSAEGLKGEYNVVVPAGDIEDKLVGRLNEIGQSITVPGFRPGKVPIGILKKRYGDSVKGEILEHDPMASERRASDPCERGTIPIWSSTRATPDPASDRIIAHLRSHRSTSAPAIGVNRIWGSCEARRTNESCVADPVS